MSGKDVRLGRMDGLQALQPRGRVAALANMAVTPCTVRRMVCEIFECYKDEASFSTLLQLSPRLSHWDIVKCYNMFLENGLSMPHTGGRVRDRNKEEDTLQATILSSRSRGSF
jgi:hypothetical protein